MFCGFAVVAVLADAFVMAFFAISRGDPMVFLREPISLAFLVAAALLLLVIAAPAIRRKREEALKE